MARKTVLLLAILVVGLGSTAVGLWSEVRHLQARERRMAAALAADSERIASLARTLDERKELDAERTRAVEARVASARVEALSQVRDVVLTARSAIQESRDRFDAQDRLIRRLAVEVDDLAEGGASATKELASQRRDLAGIQKAVETAREVFVENSEVSAMLDARSRALESAAKDDIVKVRDDLASIARRVDASEARLAPAPAPAPDHLRMYREMVAPTVQVTCDREVGSGTIIASRKRAEGGYDTYVLTALHVVEGAVAKPETAIAATIYSEGTGDTQEIDADLLAYKTPVDLALLKVRSSDPFPFVARLAPRATLSAIDIFARVYAVGCPLGYPPLPTVGELSSKTKVLAGETYWMLNAPTIFGNSGGGIFLAETGELIGVLSRVSAYNNFINIAVPHMGIFVPAQDLYDWLEAEEMQYIYDPSVTREACEARRAKRSGEARTDTGPEGDDPVKAALK